MPYEITDEMTGTTSVLTERKAEKKYGSADFTLMVAGLHARYTATNLSVAPDLEDFSSPLDDFDVSTEFAYL